MLSATGAGYGSDDDDEDDEKNGNGWGKRADSGDCRPTGAAVAGVTVTVLGSCITSIVYTPIQPNDFYINDTHV
jgi:hypothetical protein